MSTSVQFVQICKDVERSAKLYEVLGFRRRDAQPTAGELAMSVGALELTLVSGAPKEDFNASK